MGIFRKKTTEEKIAKKKAIEELRLKKEVKLKAKEARLTAKTIKRNNKLAKQKLLKK